ncbi:MAG: hypothetical protein HC811_10810 [Flammeovirgaceae bacterium]|nr:hypothetical protein [Flammeovirgaceae bacterium]
MKSIKHISLSVLVVVALGAMITFMSACGGGDDPDPVAENMTKLQSGTWKVQTVTVNGVDETDLFTGFTIKFNASTFNASNGDPIFPASGNYSGSLTSLSLDGGVPSINYEVTDTSLKMTLTWSKTTFGSGRVESISGQHVFTMNK